MSNLEIVIEEETQNVVIVVEDNPVKPIPISSEADNQAVNLIDGLYVPLPYRTPVGQTRGVSEEVVMSQDATTKEIESLEQSLSTLDNKKVDKVVGKELSDNNYSDSDKSVVDNVGSNLSDLDSRKVDKVDGYSLVQNTEIDKLATVQQYATQNSTDETLLTRSNHIGQQGMNTITGLSDKFTTKVDKVAGKSLIFDSEVTRLANMQTYTLAEKNKLAGLESSRFKGVFPSLGSLQAGVISPQAGDYADVDSAGVDVVRYIWDASDSVWLVQQGSTSITAAQVKQMYESNPDTNAFDDDSKNILDGVPLALDSKVDKVAGKSLVDDTEIAKLLTVAQDATKNATDAELRDRATHTGEQAISTVTGLVDTLNAFGNDLDSTYNLTLTKVDKETGKSLIADSEISRLAGVSNYNDAPLALRVTNLESSVGDIDTALAAILGVTP